MRHLVDRREPITMDDIDQAQQDAAAYLAQGGADQFGLVARLAAIVNDMYGTEAER